MRKLFKMNFSIKLLPIFLKLGVAIAIISFCLILIIGIVQISIGGSYESSLDGVGENNIYSFTGGTLQVSADVEQYRELVNREAKINGIGDYTNLILALMMQESGGKGNDPMQASESLCGSIGCIDDPELSIVQGVKYFKSTMQQADYDVKLGLQSYNFGSGFISYVTDRGGKYTKELAISFSQMMYDNLKHTGIYRCHSPQALTNGACYGDIGYVDSVMKYLPSATISNTGISDVLGDLHSPLSTKLIKTSGFGWRIHPIYHTKKLHAGVDINCNTGETIHAVKEGIAIDVDDLENTGLGKYVKVQHSPTSFTTYGHMSRLNIQEGSPVEAGQVVGYCGSTGTSTAPHLHFETHSSLWGGYIDPAPSLGI